MSGTPIFTPPYFWHLFNFLVMHQSQEKLLDVIMALFIWGTLLASSLLQQVNLVYIGRHIFLPESQVIRDKSIMNKMCCCSNPMHLRGFSACLSHSSLAVRGVPALIPRQLLPCARAASLPARGCQAAPQGLQGAHPSQLLSGLHLYLCEVQVIAKLVSETACFIKKDSDRTAWKYNLM